MFEETPDNAHHANAIAHPAEPRQQAANSPDDQVHFDPRLRRAVQRRNDLRIDQRIHLRNNAPTTPGGRVRRFAVDELQRAPAQRGRCHHQPAIELLPRHAGE